MRRGCHHRSLEPAPLPAHFQVGPGPGPREYGRRQAQRGHFFDGLDALLSPKGSR